MQEQKGESGRKQNPAKEKEQLKSHQNDKIV